MKINKLAKLVFAFGFLFLLSTTFSYAGFGVSPTNIFNEYLKPGASFTQEFNLSRSDATSDMNISIVPDLGGMDSWFTFDPGKTFVFKKGELTQKFKVSVKVPSDAKYTGYNGVIRVNALPGAQAIGGVSITQGVRLDANLVVTEQNLKAMSVLSIKALDSQEGKPIRLEVVGENTGNVDASPTLKVTVMDMLMNVVEEHEVANFGFIKPNETKTLVAEITSKLPTGEYFINVQVILDGNVLREERLVFNIVNIPGKNQEEENHEGKSTSLNIGSIVKDVSVYIPYILISIVIVLIAYLLIGLMWKRKDLEAKKDKIWAVALGSKKPSRMGLSVVIGVMVLLILLFYPLYNKINEREKLDVSGETQGATDTKVEPGALNVLPQPKQQEFLVYEKEDINSKVLYQATEGEQFNVVLETQDWFQVLLKDGTKGWLPKGIVKSTITKDK